jgi:hypothetical protein
LAIKLGTATPSTYKLGTASVAKAYLGSSKVWPTFSASAVLLTTGTSYTVPTGAVSMTAWAIGGGGGSATANQGGQAGGVAYKTWTVSGGQSVTYSAGAVPTTMRDGSNSTVTFSSVTITGNGGRKDWYSGLSTYGGYSGGDGGATGGTPDNLVGTQKLNARGGAVGGNASTVASCGRRPMYDVGGLMAALSLAGVSTTESCGSTAAFGSGGYRGKFVNVSAGIGGGGGGWYVTNGDSGKLGTGGAVVLQFS